MQTITTFVRQVVAQRSLAAAPDALRLSGVLACSKLSILSWPTCSAQLSTSAKEDTQRTEQQQQQATSSSSQAAADEASSSGTSSRGAGSSTSAGDSSTADGSTSAGFGGFKQQFDSFKSRLGNSSSSEQQEQVPLGQRAHQLWDTVRREVADAVLPRQERYSLTRAYDGPTYQAPDTPYEGPTALAAVKVPESKMNKVLSDLYDRFGHHPLFAKLRRVDIKDTPIFKKGAELADDIRDKYETSDHPAVHKVEVRLAAAAAGRDFCCCSCCCTAFSALQMFWRASLVSPPCVLLP
eukprot:GHRQ01014581.1.p1 GENE.GHRQ01014581.1~~GHRQ01014581.1.p1  ORF type:complete len:295 (+),score=116.80 GHRQ01014581.1:147-1031(+)